MPTSTKVTAADVRTWAVKNGLAKPGRGRLSKEAVAKYNAKHRVKF